MPAEIETMFSADNQVPWHGLGTIVKDAPNSADALKLAGLDWSVKKYPAAGVLHAPPEAVAGDDEDEDENGPTEDQDSEEAAPASSVETENASTFVYTKPSNDFYVVVRDTDQRILGAVGKRWQPIQNKDAFSFMDSVAGRELQFETAGSLKGGRRIWMLARLVGKVIEPVNGDVTLPYLLMTNLHDGSGFAWIFFTGTRVCCANTMQIALQGRKSGLRIRHSGKIEKKIELAKEVLGLAHEEVGAFGELAVKLIKHSMNDSQFQSFLEFLMPFPPQPKNTSGFDEDYQKVLEQHQRRVDKIKETHHTLKQLFESGPGTEIRGVKGTRWAALQAVTYFTSHLKKHHTDTARLDSVWFGEGNDLNQKAFSILKA